MSRSLDRRTFLLAGPSLVLGTGLSLGDRACAEASAPGVAAPIHSKLRFLWTGAATPDGIAVGVRLADGAEVKSVRLAVATDSELTAGRVYSEPLAPDAHRKVAIVTCGALAPDRSYHYGIECDGTLERALTGRFRTPPAGAHSFSFAAGSCAGTGSDAVVFDRLRARADDGAIQFFQHLGDMHYHDIAADQESFFHKAFNDVFDSARQHACWRAMPTYYMFDDHDYGPNNSGLESPSRRAALAAYRSRVPSPPLAEADAERGVYHSYIRGRVRFIVSDLRSEAVPRGRFPTDDGRQAMMSDRQLAWFQAELSSAREAGQAAIWISTRPWIGAPRNRADDWGGFHAFRSGIVDFVRANDLAGRMAVLCGDMHALAFDDGSNAPGGLPVMHAAPLDRQPSHKGGPFSAGPFPAETEGPVHQFGLIDVTDTGGDSVALRFRGISVHAATGAESVLIDERFSLAASR